MSEPDDHFRACEKHERRAEEYRQAFETNDPAWQIVFLFYSALHITDCYLRMKGGRFMADNHGQRRSALREAPEVRAMRSAYEDLKDLSESVRYQPVFEPHESDFRKAVDWHKKVKGVLAPKLKSKGIPSPG